MVFMFKRSSSELYTAVVPSLVLQVEVDYVYDSFLK
jgi:hypothetical protein